MQESGLKAIYSNLIAGRLPVGTSSPTQVVSNQMYAILGTNRLHAYILERGGFAYYFAIESRFLASNSGFLLPFAEALPGGTLHQGDAIYVLHGLGFSAAMIFENSSIRFVCNDTEVLQDYLLGLDLPTHEISSKGGKPLKSIPQTILGIGERTGSWIYKISLGVLVFNVLLFVGLKMFSAVQSTLGGPTLNVRAVENDLNATLDKVSIQQPLAMQLSRIQKVSSTVIRSGGWVQRYTIKGGVEDQFELVLPSWVSQDYLDAIGRDVVTDLRDMDGLLIVRKNVKKE